MAQYVTHFLVNWDHFCRMWAEEEHPLDALEGSERRATRDDTFSSTFWVGDELEKLRKASAQEPWWTALEACVAACLHRGAYRDLADEFAHQEGGFTMTMSPATTAWLAAQWRSVPLAEVEAESKCVLGAAEAQLFLTHVGDRMQLVATAAETGRGYVTRVG